MNPLNDISKVYLESVAVDEAAPAVAGIIAKAGPVLAKAGKAAAACAKNPACRDAAGSVDDDYSHVYGNANKRLDYILGKMEYQAELDTYKQHVLHGIKYEELI